MALPRIRTGASLAAALIKPAGTARERRALHLRAVRARPGCDLPVHRAAARAVYPPRFAADPEHAGRGAAQPREHRRLELSPDLDGVAYADAAPSRLSRSERPADGVAADRRLPR